MREPRGRAGTMRTGGVRRGHRRDLVAVDPVVDALRCLARPVAGLRMSSCRSTDAISGMPTCCHHARRLYYRTEPFSGRRTARIPQLPGQVQRQRNADAGSFLRLPRQTGRGQYPCARRCGLHPRVLASSRASVGCTTRSAAAKRAPVSAAREAFEIVQSTLRPRPDGRVCLTKDRSAARRSHLLRQRSAGERSHTTAKRSVSTSLRDTVREIVSTWNERHSVR